MNTFMLVTYSLMIAVACVVGGVQVANGDGGIWLSGLLIGIAVRGAIDFILSEAKRRLR